MAPWLLSDSTSFLPAFSLVFPTNIYSVLYRPKTVSLLINGIHSIQRGVPHQIPMWKIRAVQQGWTRKTETPNRAQRQSRWGKMELSEVKLSLLSLTGCSSSQQSTDIGTYWCGLWAQKKSVYIYIYVFIHHTKPLKKLSMFQLPVKIFEYLKPAIAL